jgi:oligosaccharide translocation protein RFT1
MSDNADQDPPAQQASGSAGSLTTARALILLQLLSRMLTFGLNQALVRLAPPEVFGTAAIQFDLICSSILFLSREGVRNALLRGGSSKHGSAPAQGVTTDGQTGTAGKAGMGKGDQDMGIRQRQDAPLAALPLYQGLLIATLLTAIYILRTPASTAAQRDFYPSLALYILSALLELSIEPLYIRALKLDPPRIQVRVQAEGGMAIVRAVVTVGSLLLLGRYERISVGASQGQGAGSTGQRALLAFALGQLGGAVWLACRYIWAFGLPQLFLGKGKSRCVYKRHNRQLVMSGTRYRALCTECPTWSSKLCGQADEAVKPASTHRPCPLQLPTRNRASSSTP